MVFCYGVEIVALGNGVACRETEAWLTSLIESSFFAPMQIKYCIVNEAGLSDYSVSNIAEEELPNMDPKLRSAVGIARRLQNPLAEYSKVEPQHLGVGMYQHDIPQAVLNDALSSVVEECTSEVGVDVNTSSESLLRKIAGIDSVTAKKIVQYREKHGLLSNKSQLLDIVGYKTYEQCAGFLRIHAETASSFRWKKVTGDGVFNSLDGTIIHPESYDIAERFLSLVHSDKTEIGKEVLIEKIEKFMTFTSVYNVADRLGSPVSTTQLIIDAFQRVNDIRGEFCFDRPLFKKSVRKYEDLKAGEELTGIVRSVTEFGVFVDTGAEKDGLIYNRKMNNLRVNTGNIVVVKTIHVLNNKKRIGLELLQVQQ